MSHPLSDCIRDEKGSGGPVGQPAVVSDQAAARLAPPGFHRAQLIDELILALVQYRNDLRYPVADDSKERRIAMIDALLAKATGAA
jgi:hypothetical protein